MAASLFFGYTFVMTASFFLLTGTVGYFSCQWFINVIYSSIKARLPIFFYRTVPLCASHAVPSCVLHAPVFLQPPGLLLLEGLVEDMDEALAGETRVNIIMYP